jgi:flagellar hook-associated protein 2
LRTSGTLTIRGGGYVDRSTNLSDLNGGRGVEAGSIRITDRSGESAVIDLSTAATIDDVINAINESADINVTATSDGDAIRLVDKTGKTDSNLIVEDIGGGETAADLGLRGINTDSDSATGVDILRLSSGTKLSSLRDGRGLDFGDGDDLAFTFRDGSTLDLEIGDFSRVASQSTGTTATQVESAALTFKAVEEGAAADGTKIRFVDDPSIVAGSETVQKIVTPSGTELVFSINAGETTAANIAAALQRDSALSDEFSVEAEGDGSGLVSVSDTATLSGGSAIEAVADPDIGDLLRVLNDANPGRLRAELAPGGDTIRLIDLTEGAGEFTVVDKGSSQVAANLGLTGAASDEGVIAGGRILSGLSSVSLSALGGGNGLGSLGTLDIETADGSTAAIDLSDAASLQDVINRLNESGLVIEASVDRSGSGLQVRDLSGGSDNQFSISSSDDTAELLGIDASTSDVLIRGGSLDLQFVSRSTKLSSLNQGRGVGGGSFKITDSLGATSAVNLTVDNVTTVGGLIDKINGLGLAVTASINETGDGIRLVDTGDGSSVLTVADSGNGTSAKLLGISGAAGNQVVDGEIVSTLNGRQVDVFRIEASDTLVTLSAKIRTSGRFASATLLGGSDGGAALSITSLKGGSAGRLAVDSTGVDLGLQQTNRGRDAVIAIGDGDGGSPAIFRSADGVFVDAIEGLTLTAKQISEDPVQIEITEDRAGIEGAINRFVEQYNKLNDRIKELTFFNSDSDEVGVLFGRGETLRIQSTLSRTLTARINTGSSLRTAADVGLRIDSTGKLNLDTAKLQSAIDADPTAVEKFFTDEKFGFSAKIDAVIEGIAGINNGLLISRSATLTSQIERNDLRVSSMNVRLENERERLLKQFNAMESAIAKLQSSQQFLSSITFFGNTSSS